MFVSINWNILALKIGVLQATEFFFIFRLLSLTQISQKMQHLCSTKRTMWIWFTVAMSFGGTVSFGEKVKRIGTVESMINSNVRQKHTQCKLEPKVGYASLDFHTHIHPNRSRSCRPQILSRMQITLWFSKFNIQFNINQIRELFWIINEWSDEFKNAFWFSYLRGMFGWLYDWNSNNLFSFLQQILMVRQCFA